jgi:Notch-like protein
MADDNGKSALHWAASVNNVEAVNTLLAHGANRDAQDSKDETPLFLACREGSYQAAKALLDHCANRDITDHMDRLPRDVAQERLHHDIVRLLQEHVPPAPQPQVSQPVMPPNMVTNEATQMQGMGNAKPRPKKRSKTVEGSPMDGSMQSPPSMMTMSGVATLPKNRRQSIKRKNPDGHDLSGLMLSPDSDANSPYDGHMYGHHLAISHPNLEEMVATSQSKQPPSYEETFSITMHQSMQAINGHGGQQESQQFFLQQQHPRQQSIPASMTYQQHLSPPHTQHHSPPGVMSPPSSVQSGHSLSPPGNALSPNQTHLQQHHHQQQQQQQQQQQTSPVKNRQQMFPTSPTHMAALRGATHQRHQSFDFPGPDNSHMTGMPMQGYYPAYPTPPQTGSASSPDSPGQWSSASPQSHSDWSEGIHSPPQTNLHHQNPLTPPQINYQQGNKAQEGIFI